MPRPSIHAQASADRLDTYALTEIAEHAELVAAQLCAMAQAAHIENPFGQQWESLSNEWHAFYNLANACRTMLSLQSPIMEEI